MTRIEIEEVTDHGERVTHLSPNSSYYAHLSIYRFAADFCRDKTVLDAGSGAGYGSFYLAKDGARSVHGVDISAKAVDFSRRHFQAANLRYDRMDVEQIAALPAHSYDVIFTSNTLEHLAHVSRFLRGACAVLAPGGLLIVAVPPITHEAARLENLANPYHLNIWSPAQWHHALSLYFAEVSCIRHHFDKPGVALDFGDTPETTPLDEADFLFLPISLAELSRLGALTAIFLARSPLSVLPANDDLPFVDDSFTRTPSQQGMAALLRTTAQRLRRRF